MTFNEKLVLIYKNVADLINNLAFIHNIENYYEPFCNNLQITKNINIKNRYCSDNNSIKIDLLKAYINEDMSKLQYITTNLLFELINKSSDGSDNIELEQLLKTLSIIYGSEECKEFELTTIEDVVKYNEETHTERFNKTNRLDRSTIKDISLECKDYRDIKIIPNSIVLSFAPFHKKNILEDKFYFKGYNEWIHELAQRKDIILLVLSNNIEDESFEIFSTFSDIVELSRRDENNLKLYQSINALDTLTTDNDW